MYEAYYRLKGSPFQLSPDPRFLFSSKGHSRAMAYLVYGANQGEGFIVITGEIGAGKTTLARALSHKLDYQPPLRMRAACLGLLGREAEARHAISRLLAASPQETLASVRAYYQRAFKQPGSCERLLEGLAKAGLAPGD